MLLRVGAIVMLRPPAPGRTTVYGLNLDPLTAPTARRGGPSYIGEPVDWRRYSRGNARSTGASDRTQLSGPTDAVQGSVGVTVMATPTRRYGLARYSSLATMPAMICSSRAPPWIADTQDWPPVGSMSRSSRWR